MEVGGSRRIDRPVRACAGALAPPFEHKRARRRSISARLVWTISERLGLGSAHARLRRAKQA